MITNKRCMYSAMLIAFLATLGASRVALAVDEVEPNDPVSSVQSLALDIGSDGTAMVAGGILNTVSHRDTDFYSFPAHQNDALNISISLPSNSALSPVIAVFGPDGTNLLALQAQMGFGLPIQVVAPQDGIYVVGVSSDPGYFVDVNSLSSSTIQDDSPYYNVNGTYTLLISGITPPAATPPVVTPPVVTPPAPPPPVSTPSLQQIAIKIRPFSRDVILAFSRKSHDFKRGHDSAQNDDFDALPRRFKSGIPVALLSSANFDALDVNQSSLKFGSTGTEASFIRCNPHGVDVNGDKLPDLVCYFDFGKANFQPGDTQGIVTGTTNSGVDLEGRGFLKILSDKRHHHHHH
ncbi:MAG: hypothetical protein WCA09_01985 [Burkholderiales bacterium]